MERVVISEDVLIEFVRLFETVRDSQFEIGDRIVEQVKLHGKAKNEVISYLASQLNVSAGVLYDYYRTAERWSPAMREIYQSLDWTIYRNADPNEDADLLDRAIDEGWNATRFKEEKYPAMKDPLNIFDRIKAILTRHKREYEPQVQRELDWILFRLEKILGEASRRQSK